MRKRYRIAVDVDVEEFEAIFGFVPDDASDIIAYLNDRAQDDMVVANFEEVTLSPTVFGPENCG